MRNDARPTGTDSHRSPFVNRQPSDDEPPLVSRDPVSNVVNRAADERTRRDRPDTDPTMPAGNSTLNTKI
jgi:hypothetical protein